MQSNSPHSFHIPVMGLAFTIDSPIKVARFGISSVISIIQDNLIEKMRKHYYNQLNEHYIPITKLEDDYRAKRITDYLNVVKRIVDNQVATMKASDFESNSDLCKYFEMLPDDHQAKYLYNQLNDCTDAVERQLLASRLNEQVKPGSIDVNIMTKLDRTTTDKEGNIVEEGSDAVSALRGFVNSSLTDASVILSAGMNPRLFAYMEKLTTFDADPTGHFSKKIVIKVSDYRSANIQGKMLAKKGLWVSEFRIESGLNCGGHAFATEGYLLGPILEEFKSKKEELTEDLFAIYSQALLQKGKPTFNRPHPMHVTVQGGIGNHFEDQFLLNHYQVDGTGWGTPFLLVPEATTVDEHTLNLLSDSREDDVYLSKNSPLGVRFHYLKGTTSDVEKMDRIVRNRPGSPCTEKYLVSNTEFTKEPICTASSSYQKRKIAELRTLDLTPEKYQEKLEEVQGKECLCIGLSNAAINQYELEPFKKLTAVNICPGPNIAYFTETCSLAKMVDHIYGRIKNIHAPDRPHMFVKELRLYVDHWSELLKEDISIVDSRVRTHIEKFHSNLMTGISYYRELYNSPIDQSESLRKQLESGLAEAERKLIGLYEGYFGNTYQAVLAPLH